MLSQAPAVGREEDVVRLDVAVEHAPAVDVLDAPRNLRHELPHPRLAQPAHLRQIRQTCKKDMSGRHIRQTYQAEIQGTHTRQ